MTLLDRWRCWLCERCPLNPSRNAPVERRKVSPEGREQWEAFARERTDVERRLALVDMQTKVIAHANRPAPPHDGTPP